MVKELHAWMASGSMGLMVPEQSLMVEEPHRMGDSKRDGG